jgi:hypothetical protein
MANWPSVVVAVVERNSGTRPSSLSPSPIAAASESVRGGWRDAGMGTARTSRSPAAAMAATVPSAVAVPSAPAMAATRAGPPRPATL